MAAFLAHLREWLAATGKPDLILAIFAGALAWFGMLPDSLGPWRIA